MLFCIVASLQSGYRAVDFLDRFDFFTTHNCGCHDMIGDA